MASLLRSAGGLLDQGMLDVSCDLVPSALSLSMSSTIIFWCRLCPIDFDLDLVSAPAFALRPLSCWQTSSF